VTGSNFSTNSPAAEQVWHIGDKNVNTKYLNFDKLNTGFIVTPVAGKSVALGLRLATANDAPERDPMTFTLEGANTPTGPWTLVASDVTGLSGLSGNRLTFAPDVIFT